jgi:predicted  nucleic acid-binding Zn-ribbon protein
MSTSSIQTTHLERSNLEAHVDLCAERYRVLEEKVNNRENSLKNMEKSVASMREDTIREFGKLREDNLRASATTNKIMMGTAGSILVGILTVIATIIMM